MGRNVDHSDFFPWWFKRLRGLANRCSKGMFVAIDYQRILMDMNRPQRRQRGVLKKLLVFLFMLALLGGGGYALWHYGLAQQAWDKAYGFVAGFLGDGGDSQTALASTDPESPISLRPQNNADTQVPRPSGPIDVATEANSAPQLRLSPPAAQPEPAPAAPARQNPAPVQAADSSLRPSAPASQRAAGPNMAPTPVLSDAKAQIKAIDQMLGSNPAEALRRVEDLLKMKLEPDEAAEAGYRLGYAARMLRDEAKAEQSWKETAEKYPTLLGGRYSALALADTWYFRYAGERPQISYWDDIQLMYSRVIGQDDAPFLPDNLKAEVKNKLNRVNDAIFFGTGPTKLARHHRVESGELLGSIANKYRVDYESIARINGVNPNRIRVGLDLKIIVGEVNIIVRKNAGSDKTPTLTWYLDGRWMREYPTCVGDGDKTPVGNYNLTSKERDPSWTNPLNGQLLPNDHPDNILGSRWMAMAGMNTQGLGIHGTTVDDSIPGYTSAGCVRLLNKDVEELFSFSRITNRVTVLE